MLSTLQKTLQRDSARIHALAQTCLKCSYATEASPAWQSFVEYYDSLLRRGLIQILAKSLRHICAVVCQQQDSLSHAPILNVKVCGDSIR